MRDERRWQEGSRGVLLRDVAIFNIKLLLDELKGLVFFQLALGAALIDLVFSPAPRLFYTVLRWAERVDLWLNLYGAAEQMEEHPGDGLFGGSAAGSDTLLGRLEAIVRRKVEAL